MGHDHEWDVKDTTNPTDDVISDENWVTGTIEILELWSRFITVDSYWRTRDGRYLRIRKMTTQHLKNCIAMLVQRSPNHPLSRGYARAMQDALDDRTTVTDVTESRAKLPTNPSTRRSDLARAYLALDSDPADRPS